jgi:cold shock CspA family protein
VHFSAIEGGREFKTLTAGETVAFHVVSGPKGAQASEVTRVTQDSAPATL